MSTRGWFLALLLAVAGLVLTIGIGLHVRALRLVAASSADAARAAASQSAPRPASPLEEYELLMRGTHWPRTRPVDADRPAQAQRQARLAAEQRAAEEAAEEQTSARRTAHSSDPGAGPAVFGIVTEANRETPVPEATVTLINTRTGQPVQTNTNAQGEFTLANCLAERHELIVTSPRHIPRRRTVTPDPERERLEIVMSPGQELAGRVLDVSGNPMANVRVEIPRAGRRAATDANGEFVLDCLENREHDLIFTETEPPYHVAERQNVMPGDGALEIVLGWQSATVAGRVIDGGSGSPQTSFTVAVHTYDLENNQPLGSLVEVRSDPQGEFELALNQPGRHQIEVRVGAGPVIDREVVVTEAGQRFQDFEFEVPDMNLIGGGNELASQVSPGDPGEMASAETTF